MRVSAKEMQEMASDRMALRPRLGYTGLLLIGIAGAVVTGSLWATEPALPGRTQLAFAVMLAINLSWAAFATWVLTRRRVLLARHSVVAASMAVAFSAAFVVTAVAIGYWGGAGRAMYGAAGAGLVMCAMAVLLLVRARQRFARLVERKRELERALGAGLAGGPATPAAKVIG